MALTPLAVHTITEQVLACVCEALAATAEEIEGYPGCPCRACVVPGEPAWDSCADPCSGETGGQLTVHVVRLFGSENFPEATRPVLGLRGCTPPATTAVELAVTLLRCAPGPDEGGCPPSCEELAAAARITHIDMAVVHSALVCCLPKTGGRRGRRFTLTDMRTVGPQGNCVGVEQRLIVALPGCGKCPDDPS